MPYKYERDGQRFFRDITQFTSTSSPQITKSNSSSQVIWENNVLTGDNIPNWRNRLARGLGVITSLNGDKISYEFSPGFVTRVRKYTGTANAIRGRIQSVRVVGDLSNGFSTIGPYGLSVSEADNEAKMQINNRIRAAQSAFSGGVFTGEIRETMRMLRRPMLSLRNGLNDFAKAQIAYARRTVRNPHRNRAAKRRAITSAITGSWLETQFGLIPFVSDIKKISEAAGFRELQKPPSRVVSAEASTSATSDAFGGGVAVGVVSVECRRVTQDSTSVKYTAQVRCPTSGSVPDAQYWGLSGFQDFVPTVYELIPWSWAVDYFSNVGDLVEALSMRRANVGWVVRNELKERKQYNTGWSDKYVQDPDLNPQQFYMLSPHLKIRTHRVVHRSDFSDQSLVPNLDFKIPGMNGRGFIQSLNLAAVAIQRRLPSRLLRELE